MARDFDGTDDELTLGSAVLTAEPITMACWKYFDSSVSGSVLMSLTNNGTSGHWHLRETSGGNLVAEKQDDSGNLATALISSGSNWVHACAVFDSGNLSVYRNGSRTATVHTINDPTVDFTSIGSRKGSSSGSFWDGRIAEAAIWNIALGSGSVARLVTGIVPLCVHPESLVAYWPLWGSHSPELDLVGGNNLTVTGATKIDHPRIVRPSRAQRRKYSLPFRMAHILGS
jgi:hypothetical protein